MKLKQVPFTFIIFLSASLFWGCTGFTLFDGNTKRDYRDYGLEQRANYRKTRTLNKVIQNEKDAEILYRLKEDEKRKNKTFKKSEPQSKELYH